MTPAGHDPVKPHVLQPRLALPNLIRCQTSLNSLTYRANFGNYERVTDSCAPRLECNWKECASTPCWIGIRLATASAWIF